MTSNNSSAQFIDMPIRQKRKPRPKSSDLNSLDKSASSKVILSSPHVKVVNRVDVNKQRCSLESPSSQPLKLSSDQEEKFWSRIEFDHEEETCSQRKQNENENTEDQINRIHISSKTYRQSIVNKLLKLLLIPLLSLVLQRHTVSAQQLLKQYRECPDPNQPEFIFEHSGELTSANYGFSNYKDGQNCSWIIQAPSNRRIKLMVLDARLESTNGNTNDQGTICVDYLEIRDPAVPEEEQDAPNNHGLYWLCTINYNDKDHTSTIISEGTRLGLGFSII